MLVSIGAFKIELLSLLILHRALWNGSSIKRDKGVTFIIYACDVLTKICDKFKAALFLVILFKICRAPQIG